MKKFGMKYFDKTEIEKKRKNLHYHQLKRSYKKGEDSLETRAVLLIFLLES